MPVSGRPVVLVIDDQEPVRRLFEQTLTCAGFVVLDAVDGFGAMETAAREQPDVIVLDGDLPVVNGCDVCRTLRTQDDTWATPIIFLTGVSAPSYRDAAFEAGADLVVTKPVTPEDLVSLVQSMTRSAWVPL